MSNYYYRGWSQTQAEKDAELLELRQRANHNLKQNLERRAHLVRCPAQQ